jgi:hypothetical protein
MSKIFNNTTSLQEVLEVLQTKAAGENLDEGISTQSTLITEQEAKLAELAEILSNKATGSGDNGSPTISVTISADMCLNGAFYFDENSMLQNVPIGIETVDALNGIVFTKTPAEIIFASGNYILSAEGANGVHAVRFLEDGGTASISME